MICVLCVRKHAHARGVWWYAPPGNLDTLRLLLRPLLAQTGVIKFWGPHEIVTTLVTGRLGPGGPQNFMTPVWAKSGLKNYKC